MNEMTELFKQRRTVRKFKNTPIEEQELIQNILEPARWSQSWANTQCWEVVLIQSAQTKEALFQTIPKGNPAGKAVVDAPVVLAVCGRKETSGYYKGKAPTRFGDWMLFDLGIFSQNICLAAHAQGLGSVVIGLFDHDQAEKVLEVPEGIELVCLIPLGYPAENPNAPKRKEINDFMHKETF